MEAGALVKVHVVYAVAGTVTNDWLPEAPRICVQMFNEAPPGSCGGRPAKFTFYDDGNRRTRVVKLADVFEITEDYRETS